jgi:hypothetical protein
MNVLAPALEALKPVFVDLGRAIEAAASSADGEWCGSITLPEGFFGREPIDGLQCVVGTRRVTIRGELARLDWNLGDGPRRSPLKDVLLRLTELAALPHLKSLGEVVVRETKEGFVILRHDLGDGHG